MTVRDLIDQLKEFDPDKAIKVTLPDASSPRYYKGNFVGYYDYEHGSINDIEEFDASVRIKVDY